jgi:hypothetical protein
MKITFSTSTSNLSLKMSRIILMTIWDPAHKRTFWHPNNNRLWNRLLLLGSHKPPQTLLKLVGNRPWLVIKHSNLCVGLPLGEFKQRYRHMPILSTQTNPTQLWKKRLILLIPRKRTFYANKMCCHRLISGRVSRFCRRTRFSWTPLATCHP